MKNRAEDRDPVERPRWSASARRLGIVSSSAIFVIGLAYLAVIALWMLVERTPREPIGDPYLAAMEALTMLSALALFGFVLTLWCFAGESHRLQAMAALISGCLAAVVTMTVHFVQLTAVRQLWRAGRLPDYRLVWPSVIFAVEYFAWDVLVGLTLLLASFALSGPGTARARTVLLSSGGLCLLGTMGPLSGNMALQNIAVLGYGVVLPISGAIAARMFGTVAPVNRALPPEPSADAA
jgi:hypothetical protein